MNITDIISVSPVNPAHGRHEVHAKNANGVPVTFTISPNALGSLTGHFGRFIQSDEAYAEIQKLQQKALAASPRNIGS